MMDALLKQIFVTQWHVLLIVGLLLIVAAEAGYRAGHRLYGRKEERARGQIGSLQGAILGLLGLLLGFTFAMGLQRHDHRRALVVDEANAIGTTYLRASLLPEPHRTAVEELLWRYLDLRLAFYGSGEDDAALVEVERASTELQQRLWSHAVAAGRIAPTPLTASFIAALNETIDVDASRLAARRNLVPATVWLLLLLVAACGSWATGYMDGANGKRLLFGQILFPLLVTVVITLVVDLASPRRGLIGISQQSLVDLKHSLAPPNR